MVLTIGIEVRAFLGKKDLPLVLIHRATGAELADLASQKAPLYKGGSTTMDLFDFAACLVYSKH